MDVKAYLLPKNVIDKHGKPMDSNMVRFSNKKIVISEKVDPLLGL